MEIIRLPKEMQARAEKIRNAGKKISFVPTMGYFHEGHTSLMDIGKRLADVLVVSLFVNPTQFGPTEDYKSYPRDFERDCKIASEHGCDIMFAPEVSDFYPEGYQTWVTVEELTKTLCGASRPTHFRGVATVVAKLFNCVKPHYAVFGKKDYQQLKVVEQMVRDLNFDIEIIEAETYREPDGLAMSSRNTYLNPDERKAATCLIRALREVESAFKKGERNAEKLRAIASELISSEPLANIDYIEIASQKTMQLIKGVIKEPVIMALAVKIGKARLIDNIELNVGE